MASCGGKGNNPFLTVTDDSECQQTTNPFELGFNITSCTGESPAQPPQGLTSSPSSHSLPPSTSTSSSTRPSSRLFGGSATDDQDEFSERFLTCTICLETYSETPKLLPCMHSFCRVCIRKLAEEKCTITCPVCRREVQVPLQGGVDALPNNIFVRDLTDFLSEQPNRPQVSSTAHGSQSVTQRPRTGSSIGNEQKINRHASGNIFQRVAIRMKLQFSSKNKRNCQYHSEKELKYYCRTCHIIVCKKCIRFEHEDGHMILNLKSAAEERVHSINTLLFEAETSIPPLELSRNNANTKLQSLRERHTKTKSEINDAFGSIRQILQQQETACLSKLNLQYQLKNTVLSSQLNDLDLQLSTVKSACVFSRRTVDDLRNADYEMVAMSGQLTARIEEVLAMQKRERTDLATDNVLEVEQNVECMQEIKDLIKKIVVYTINEHTLTQECRPFMYTLSITGV